MYCLIIVATGYKKKKEKKTRKYLPTLRSGDQGYKQPPHLTRLCQVLRHLLKQANFTNFLNLQL